MDRGLTKNFRREWRVFFVLFLAYFAAFNATVMPILRAQAMGTISLEKLLSERCLTTGLSQDEGEQSPSKGMSHDLGCCILCKRLVVDEPALTEYQFDYSLQSRRIAGPVVYAFPDARGPPSGVALERVQPRAPPLNS